MASERPWLPYTPFHVPCVTVSIFTQLALDEEIGCGFTVNVKFCVPLGVRPLFAVIVKEVVELELAVPLNVAVPFMLSTKLIPAGSPPLSVSAGVG